MVSLLATQSTRRHLRADRRSPRPAVGKQWDGGGTSAGPSLFTTARSPRSRARAAPRRRVDLLGRLGFPPGIRDAGEDRSGCTSPAVASSMTAGDGRRRTVAIAPPQERRHHHPARFADKLVVTNGNNNLAERSRQNLGEATNSSERDRKRGSSSVAAALAGFGTLSFLTAITVVAFVGPSSLEDLVLITAIVVAVDLKGPGDQIFMASRDAETPPLSTQWIAVQDDHCEQRQLPARGRASSCPRLVTSLHDRSTAAHRTVDDDHPPHLWGGRQLRAPIGPLIA
jgi:hypothetical protein